MSRGQKVTKADKRERRRRADLAEGHAPPLPNAPGPDPMMTVVSDFGSAAFTAAAAASICADRLDDLVSDTVVMRIAADVWKDRPGPAEPLAAHLVELVVELRRHGDRLRALRDQLAAIAESEAELPELTDAQLAEALEAVIRQHRAVADAAAAPELP